MKPSTIRTVTVPNAILNPNPAPIVHGVEKPMRALIRNSGGTLIFIGYAPQDVSPAAGGGATSSSYRLPPGASDVFVISEKQILYAAAAGPGGLASIALSEAFPML